MRSDHDSTAPGLTPEGEDDVAVTQEDLDALAADMHASAGTNELHFSQLPEKIRDQYRRYAKAALARAGQGYGRGGREDLDPAEVRDVLAGMVLAWREFYPDMKPQDRAESAEFGPMLKGVYLLGRLLDPPSDRANEIEARITALAAPLQDGEA